jgi:hypothetical protein
MSDDFGKMEIEVDGKAVDIDLAADLTIDDLSKDMDEVAAKMAYWGAVWAAAEAEAERVDTHYRSWRAEYGRQLLEANEKLAEWKVKQEIEASPKFKRYKEGVAIATRNKTMLRAIFESWRVKASQLQSKGAMARAELDSTGMHTKSSEGDDKMADDAAKMRRAKRKRAGS